MSSRSDAGNIVINTASSGRSKNVARKIQNGVTHNGAGPHSSTAPEAKSTVARMEVENDSPPTGDQSNNPNFAGNNNNYSVPPANNAAPANNGAAAGKNDDDDVSIRTVQLDASSVKSSRSRSSASAHLLAGGFKICSNNKKHVYAPETGGYVCPTPKCDYVLCTDCADAAHAESENENVPCPECKATLTYDVNMPEDADAGVDADIDPFSLMQANKDRLAVLAKKLPKYISHTKLGLRKLRDAIILAEGNVKAAADELKEAQDAKDSHQVIIRLTLARDNADIALRQAELNQPYIKILKEYLEIKDKINAAEKDFNNMRRNAEAEQKQRVKIALAEMAAEDANAVDDIDTLLEEEERQRELRAAQRRQRDNQRYQAKKDRVKKRIAAPY